MTTIVNDDYNEIVNLEDENVNERNDLDDVVMIEDDEEEDSSENDDYSFEFETEGLPPYWSREVVKKIPTIKEFYFQFGSEEDCQRFLLNFGIYYGQNEVIRCGGDTGSVMYLEERGSKIRWRCNGKIINVETGEKCCNGRIRTVRRDSFFSYRKLPISDVLSILYLWSIGSITRKGIARMVGCHPNTVSRIIREWYQILQEDIQVNDCQIGGIDENGNSIIVEIDESKFGKRKYHRGHHVEGCWVVGGIERTRERKCFLVVVPKRDGETLRSIIETYVKPGSTVYTDCWKGYDHMEEWGMDLIHRTVNHSITFRDGDVCTNTIEGTWNGIKINIKPAMRTKKMMPWLLVEFIWRRKHHSDIWGGVLKCLKEVSFNSAINNPAWVTLFADEED